MYCYNCGNKLKITKNGKCASCKCDMPENISKIISGSVSEYDDFDDITGNIYFCILYYLGPLFLFGLNKKESDFCCYHFKQGAFTAIIYLLGFISLFAFKSVVFVPILFFLIGAFFSAVGIMNVANGEKKPLPVVGEYIIKFFDAYKK